MRGALRIARRAPIPDSVSASLSAGWPGLMLRKFSSDEACGACFGRTRQTGSNWREGRNKPDGPAVALAALLWPEDFAALFAGVR